MISGASASGGMGRMPGMLRSLITIREVAMAEERLDPVHPGEVLLEEFLRPLGLSQNRLALDIGVHPRRINEIVLKKRAITANTALRLARYFGTTPEFWLGLQNQYDLDIERDRYGEVLEQEVHVHEEISKYRS